MSALWSQAGGEREEEAQAADAGRAGGGIRSESMGSDQNVDRGFFPLDKELELLAGGLTPRGYEDLVRLSSWMPFERAVELMEDM